MAGAAVGYILSALDLLVYLCTLGPVFTILKLLKGKPVVKALTNASDAPRRRATSEKTLLTTPFPEANVGTLHDLMWHCGKIYANRPCFGTRTYLGEGTPDPEKGQRFPPRVFGETTWITVTPPFSLPPPSVSKADLDEGWCDCSSQHLRAPPTILSASPPEGAPEEPRVPTPCAITPLPPRPARAAPSPLTPWNVLQG